MGIFSKHRTLTFPDGAKYVGEVKDGVPHGQGTYTSSDGDKYVGEFKDGRRYRRSSGTNSMCQTE